MSYNQLKSTQVCGTLSVANYPDGSQIAYFNCGGNANITGNLNVGGSATVESLSPLTAISVSSTSTIPNTTTTECVVYCRTGSGNYTITLPSPTSGYTLWFYNANTNQTTIASPTTLYYENPLGTFNVGTSIALITNAAIGCYADGSNWYIFFNSGLYSPLGSGALVLQHLSYSSSSNSVICDCNFVVDGLLTVQTGPLSLPNGSVEDSAINNAAIQNGYVDFTSSGQTQINNINTELTHAAFTNVTNTFTAQQDFTNGIVVTGAPSSISFPANSIQYQWSNSSCIANGYCDTTYSINGEFTNLQNQINAIDAVTASGNNVFTGTNQFNNVTTLDGACNSGGNNTWSGNNNFSGKIYSSPNGAIVRGAGYVNTSTFGYTFNINTSTSVLWTGDLGSPGIPACWINLTDNSECLGIVIGSVYSGWNPNPAGQTVLTQWKPMDGPPSAGTTYDALFQTYNGGSSPSEAIFAFYFIIL